MTVNQLKRELTWAFFALAKKILLSRTRLTVPSAKLKAIL